MTQIKHLPGTLREELIKQGYQAENNVTWLSQQPEFNDRFGDGALTFSVHNAQQSGYVHITAQGEWQYHSISNSSSSPMSSRLSQRFAAQLADTSLVDWAAQQEKALGKKPDTSSMPAEIEQSSAAGKALEAYMQHPVPFGVFTEATRLPIGHPAKDFMEAMAMRASDDAARDHFYTMKSTAVFYQFGQEYSRTHAIQDQKIQILYPAAGPNIGSLATAMALIEGGAREINMIGTEAAGPGPTREVTRVLTTLQAWAEHNPNLQLIDHGWQIQQGERGKRYRLSLEYLGRRIELTFALGDAPQNPRADARERGYSRPVDNIPRQYYFDPRDWQSSQIILLHDAYADRGQSDLLLLKQLAGDLSSVSPGQTLLLPDGFGFSPQLASLVPKDLVRDQDYILPFGNFISGYYGHAYNVKVKRGVWGESGVTHAAGARWFSFDQPILAETIQLSQAEPNEKYWEAMLDFFQLVASRQKVVGDPEMKGNGKPDKLQAEDKFFSRYTSSGQEDYVVGCLKWLSKILPRLGREDQEKLIRLAAYAFYLNLNDAAEELAKLGAEKLGRFLLPHASNKR